MSVLTRCNYVSSEKRYLGKQIHLRYMQTTQQKDPDTPKQQNSIRYPIPSVHAMGLVTRFRIDDFTTLWMVVLTKTTLRA